MSMTVAEFMARGTKPTMSLDEFMGKGAEDSYLDPPQMPPDPMEWERIAARTKDEWVNGPRMIDLEPFREMYENEEDPDLKSQYLVDLQLAERQNQAHSERIAKDQQEMKALGLSPEQFYQKGIYGTQDFDTDRPLDSAVNRVANVGPLRGMTSGLKSLASVPIEMGLRAIPNFLPGGEAASSLAGQMARTRADEDSYNQYADDQQGAASKYSRQVVEMFSKYIPAAVSGQILPFIYGEAQSSAYAEGEAGGLKGQSLDLYANGMGAINTAFTALGGKVAGKLGASTIEEFGAKGIVAATGIKDFIKKFAIGAATETGAEEIPTYFAENLARYTAGLSDRAVPSTWKSDLTDIAIVSTLSQVAGSLNHIDGPEVREFVDNPTAGNAAKAGLPPEVVKAKRSRERIAEGVRVAITPSDIVKDAGPGTYSGKTKQGEWSVTIKPSLPKRILDALKGTTPPAVKMAFDENGQATIDAPYTVTSQVDESANLPSETPTAIEAPSSPVESLPENPTPEPEQVEISQPDAAAEATAPVVSEQVFTDKKPAYTPAKDEPALAPETIRFYHGGDAYDGGPRWFTQDRRQAQGYVDKHASANGVLQYVDVPVDHPFLKGVNKGYDDEGLPQTAPYVAFDAPEELAAGLKPLTPPKPVLGRRKQPVEPEMRKFAQNPDPPAGETKVARLRREQFERTNAQNIKNNVGDSPSQAKGWIRSSIARRPSGIETPAEIANWVSTKFDNRNYWKLLKQDGVTLEDAIAREMQPNDQRANLHIPPDSGNTDLSTPGTRYSDLESFTTATETQKVRGGFKVTVPIGRGDQAFYQNWTIKGATTPTGAIEQAWKAYSRSVADSLESDGGAQARAVREQQAAMRAYAEQSLSTPSVAPPDAPSAEVTPLPVDSGVQRPVLGRKKKPPTFEQAGRKGWRKVYHGTKADFDGPIQPGEAGDYVGVYFTDDPAASGRWAGWSGQAGESRIIEAYADLKNPASFSDVADAKRSLGTEWTREQLTNELKSRGFDGVVDDSYKGNEVVVFDPAAVVTKPAPKKKLGATKEAAHISREYSRMRRTESVDADTLDFIAALPKEQQQEIYKLAADVAKGKNEYYEEVLADFDAVFKGTGGKWGNAVRGRERAGRDASRIDGFDELVDEIASNYPSLRSYMNLVGKEDLEAGLFDILKGGRKGLEAKLETTDDYIYDIAENYRGTRAEGTSEVGDSGGFESGPVDGRSDEGSDQSVDEDSLDDSFDFGANAEEDFQLTRTPAPAPFKKAEFDNASPSTQKAFITGVGKDDQLQDKLLFDTDGVGSKPAEPLGPLDPKLIPTTPKSQREIITDLAEAFRLPIRFGRILHKKHGGTFFAIENLIQVKKANALPTVAHEIGHKIDTMFGLSDNKAIKSELNTLGDPDTPGSHSSWTKSKTAAYKRGEGVAEFIRYWLTEPSKAKADAPNTFEAFEQILEGNKDMADTLRQAQQDIKLWRTAEPQARLRSHISRGENPNGTRYSLSQLTRDAVDDLHFMRLAVDDAKLAKPDLPPSKNPYLLARNLRGSYGMAETFIRTGVAKFHSKDVDLGTSLEDALKPVGGKLRDFGDWMVAKRAQELHKQGRETGLVPADVDAVVKAFDNDPVFQKAFKAVKAWNDAVLQYAVDSGLVTQESAAAMREMNQDYVPFHRLFEVGAGEAPSNEASGRGSGLNPGKPGSLKRLHGSTRNIVDPLETMVKNAYAVITASEKAAISNAVADMAHLPDMGKWVEKVSSPQKEVRVPVDRIRKQLEDEGANLENVEDDLLVSFFQPANSPVYGENTIRIIRNGEPEFYRLNRYLHDTFQALDLDDAGKFIRIISAPAQLLRAGVVLEPSFNIANALRDTIGAAVLNKHGALPFETTIRGVAALINKPELVAEWAAAGGRSSVEANYFDRKKMQRYLAEKISKELTPAERALIVAKSPLTFLRWMATQFEEATRIGEYEIAYKDLTKGGMPKGEARRLAAFEARDRQDFAKGGAKTKIIRHAAAFWNAALQANVRLAQAFKERPLETIAKGVAFVTLPKLLEQALNWDDEDYWDRPQWERDAFYMIPIGKDDAGHTRFLRLPVPFEIGVIFGSVPGRFLAWAKENRPEAVQDLPQVILKQAVPIPNFASLLTVFELMPEQGYSMFRDREIVPDSVADAPPWLEWTEQTSALAKKVGETFNISPLKIDYLIDSTTGGIGKTLVGRQIPGERFVTRDLAVAGEPINEFYEIRKKLGEDAYELKATGKSKGFGPVMAPVFEDVAEQIGTLRNEAKAATDPKQKAALQDQAFQLAKKTVEDYRKNPEPDEAVKAYAEKMTEKALLSTDRPVQKTKKRPGGTRSFKVESDEDYDKRLKEWEVRRDQAVDWLSRHRDSAIVKQAVVVVKRGEKYKNLSPTKKVLGRRVAGRLQ